MTDTPIAIEVNCETGEVVERPLTAEEIAQREVDAAAAAARKAEEDAAAEALAGQGITKAQAQQGYQEVAGILPRASQLADIYGKTLIHSRLQKQKYLTQQVQQKLHVSVRSFHLLSKQPLVAHQE